MITHLRMNRWSFLSAVLLLATLFSLADVVHESVTGEARISKKFGTQIDRRDELGNGYRNAMAWQVFRTGLLGALTWRVFTTWRAHERNVLI